MKKIRMFTLIAALGLNFIGATTNATIIDINNINVVKSDKNVKKEYNVKPGGKVIIDLQNGGDIEIIGWNKDLVSVDVEVSGRNADDINVEIEQQGNEISISTYYDGSRNNNRSREKVFVNVPEQFNVEFETMGGGVKIKKVKGEMEGKTMGGQLHLSDLKGKVEMTTMGGNISITDSEVDGQVKTMGGEVLVENVVGDLDASSMGGNVIQRNVKGNKNPVGKEVNISTMGGEINVDSAPNGAKVKTMGGDIIINSASKFVDAITYGGNIEIKKVDGKVKAKTLGGDVDVKFIGSGDDKDIEITSLGGDMTLSVPSDFSMDVFVEIAFTKDGNGSFEDFEDVKVDGDLKLEEKRSDKWDYSNGSPRKYCRAKGSFNGGKNKVIVKTINGKVTLLKS